MAALTANTLVAPKVDQDFWSWLREQSLIIRRVIDLGLAYELLKVPYDYMRQQSKDVPGDSLSFLVQLVVIAVLLFLIWVKKPTRPRDNDADKDRNLARKAVRQFWHSFIMLFVLFAVLYADLLVGKSNGLPQWLLFPIPAQHVCKASWNLFNNLSTLDIAICYTILRHKTLDIEHRKLWMWGLSALAVLLVLAGLEYSAHLSGAKPAEDTFAWLSAGAACVVIALLTEELGSPEIGAPQSLVVILYCYAGVQLTWPFVIGVASDAGLAQIGLIGPLVALLGKCVMVLLIVWSIDVGRLEFYMLESRKRLNDVGDTRRKFLQQTRAISSASG